MQRSGSRNNNTVTPKSGPASVAIWATTDSHWVESGIVTAGTPAVVGILHADLTPPADQRDQDAVWQKCESNRARDNRHQCECQELHRRVELLVTTVKQQKEVITKLLYKLKSVISFLDIQKASVTFAGIINKANCHELVAAVYVEQENSDEITVLCFQILG
jgi:hypothetical protein